MDRLACVDVAALPLQLLLRAHPDWRSWPTAVVEDDRPQAAVLFVNRYARRAGVRSGQRYATALALARELRAGTIAASDIAHEIRALLERLRRYSPHVEPSPDRPGVFWLDASGLDHLYTSLQVWADGIRLDLRGIDLRASVAVGFSRFGTYALACGHCRTLVCTDAAAERARVADVPLWRLPLTPDVRDRLLALGIRTVGEFARLPADGMRARFGTATEDLHRLATGHRWDPLVPTPVDERYERAVEFDAPERTVDRLIFIIKRLLDTLVMTLEHQALAAIAVVVQMTFDNRTTDTTRVCPASPTLDVSQLLTLVRLRLDTVVRAVGGMGAPGAGQATLGSRVTSIRVDGGADTTSAAAAIRTGIVELRVELETCPATADQRRLFMGHTRRDTHAANEALARLRAEYGERSVVRAHLCDAHLPAARFTWEPMTGVTTRAMPRVVAVRPLVRRIHATPVPLPMSAPPLPADGPYFVSGGWWRGGVRRDYYYMRTRQGELWWMYFDHTRKRWFLQGVVE